MVMLPSNQLFWVIGLGPWGIRPEMFRSLGFWALVGVGSVDGSSSKGYLVGM